MRVPDYDAAAAAVARDASEPELENPIDAAAAEVVATSRRQERSALRASLYSSLLTDPEVAARAQQLGRQVGLPGEIVERNLPDVQRTARMSEIEHLVESSPTVARWIAEQDNAKVAHDDIENLTAIERALRFGAELPGVAAGGVERTSAGVVGVVRAPFELAAPALDPLVGRILPANPLRATSEGLRRWQESIKSRADSRIGTSEGIVEGGVRSGVASLAPNMATLPLLAFGPPGWTAYMLGMVLPVFGNEYAEAREKGLSPLGATIYGSSQATVEYATERLPLRFLVGDLKAGTGFAKMLARQVAAEIPGEQVATVLQDLNEWAALNPQKTAADYLRERPSAAAQTLIATIIGAGGQTSIVKGVDATIRRFAGDAQRIEAAQRHGQALDALTAAAAASKLRERDPEAFASLVATAVADGPVQDVFIEAETLAQALDPKQLEQLSASSPAIAAQIAEAGTVAIPLEQFASLPPQVAQALVPHVRTDPDGLSLTEAESFGQSFGDELQAELDAMLERETDEPQGQQDPVATIRDTVAREIERTGRFRPEVVAQYAELVAQAYGAFAQRSGLDAGQFFEEFAPRIVSQLGLDTATQLDQEAADAQPASPTATTEALPAQDPAAEPTLDQGAPLAQGRRAAYDPSTRTIALFEQADLSSFLHELGHHFLELQAELAARPDAPPQVVADMQALLAWFGVDSLATWQGMTLEQKRPHHEQFARGFEAYLFEGKAPSVELAGPFQRFRAWLVQVYKRIKALGVDLSDDVRAVMDRMLATDEQIAQAEAARAYQPLFESAEAAGMTPEEFAAYQAEGGQATSDAVDALQARSLRDLQWLRNARGRVLKRLQREADAIRKAIREEVRAEVDAMPIYAAWRDLARGKTAEGERVRLSRPELEQTHPELVERLPARMAVADGIPADLVAEAYGIDSGDALVKMLASLEPPDQVVEAMVDARMLERHGDVADPAAMERAADVEIHNDARARALARETTALARATGSPRALAQAARQYAEAAIARRLIRHVRPSVFTRAEARAGRAADEAFRKGDTAAAADRKREQLLQHQLARTAGRVELEVSRAIDYLRRFDTAATRKAIGPDYADQIDALLERFDLKRSTTLREIQRRQSLAKWVESQREMGFEPVIDEALLADSTLVSYRDMTVEQLRGLRDAVKNIEHLGRLKQRLLTDREKRDFATVVTEISSSIVEHGGKARDVELEPRRGLVPWLQGVVASHRKISSLVRQMDGDQDAGPLWRAFVRPMNEAADREQGMLEAATVELARLLKPVTALRGGIAGGKVFIPEIGTSLSRGGRLAIALNMGNPTNRQRLLDGENWQPSQAQAVMATLTRVELEAVNAIWAYVDSYWPQIEAKALRVDGIAPEKVQGEPFTVRSADGATVAMRGGYYPIKYDADRSSRAESQEAAQVATDMLRGAFVRATTRRGHTKQRLEEVKRPLRKDLDVLTGHIGQVIHDLAWHEWLIDANRLLGARAIDSAIRTRYGPEVLRTIKDNLVGIATGDLVAQTRIDQGLRFLRGNISRNVMGLSVTTAMLQPFGLANSMARIGTVPVLRGLARWGGDALRFESSLGWIREKSDFMRRRAATFNRELAEINRRLEGRSTVAQIRDVALFTMMQKLQLVADVPTWIGQYERAIAEGRDEATAVALADQAVIDAQGGGQTKDLSEVQRKHPFLGQFYSYFSTTLNLVIERTAATEFRNPKAVAGWLADMTLLAVIPAQATAIVLDLLKGADFDDDDPEDWAERLARAQLGYLLGFFIGARELSGPVSGYDYSGPPLSRSVTTLDRLATQVRQGELDEPAVMALIDLVGLRYGLPTVQMKRSYRGWKAWDEGKAPITSILFGPPPRD